MIPAKMWLVTILGVRKMYFIGITGGVGAGKTAILQYLSEKDGVRVMLADEIAHELMESGTECYRRIEETFQSEDIFLPEGGLDRLKMAKVIFSSEEKRNQMNSIVHPAVKQYVIETAKREQKEGKCRVLVLEAALLIEEHYDEICDELWYIFTSEETRESRLMDSRGYSKEKVHQIFASQLREEEYRTHCRVVIDNNGSIDTTFSQIDEALANLK